MRVILAPIVGELSVGDRAAQGAYALGQIGWQTQERARVVVAHPSSSSPPEASVPPPDAGPGCPAFAMAAACWAATAAASDCAVGGASSGGSGRSATCRR